MKIKRFHFCKALERNDTHLAVIYFPSATADPVPVAFMYRCVKWGITMSGSNCIPVQHIAAIEIAILDVVFSLARAVILFCLILLLNSQSNITL